ncbi:hypothetical protein KNE206_14140 [Kitasatospora sp. NE20-6]
MTSADVQASSPVRTGSSAGSTDSAPPLRAPVPAGTWVRLVAARPVLVLVFRRAVLTVPSPGSPATASRARVVAVRAPVALSAMAFDLIHE